MSARLSRAELGVLVEDLLRVVNEFELDGIDPNAAFNFGVLSAGLIEIEHGLYG